MPLVFFVTLMHFLALERLVILVPLMALVFFMALMHFVTLVRVILKLSVALERLVTLVPFMALMFFMALMRFVTLIIGFSQRDGRNNQHKRQNPDLHVFVITCGGAVVRTRARPSGQQRSPIRSGA